MGRSLIFFFIFVLCLTAAEKKRKPAKPPEIEVIEATARRAEGKIALDGRVRNTSAKPLRGLILLFDFMAPGRAVITTKKGPVEDESLEPGQESVFRMELTDPVRAVEFQIAAVEENERDLRIANPGPFAIE